MKKWMICLLVFLLIIICGGNVMSESLITPERFREYVEWELDVSDEVLIDIIKHNNITEETLNSLLGINKNLFINRALDKSYVNRYKYLFRADTIEPADHSIQPNHVLRIATSFSYGVAQEIILIDLENGNYYYDSVKDCFEDVEQCELNRELTENQQNFIYSLIETTPWNDFKYKYTSDEDDWYIADAVDWSLAIETTDGIVRYNIGAAVNDYPSDLVDFGKKLINGLVRNS